MYGQTDVRDRLGLHFMPFHYSSNKRGIKNVGGVMILFLRTSSDGFMKIFLMVSKLYSGHYFHRKNFKGS